VGVLMVYWRELLVVISLFGFGEIVMSGEKKFEEFIFG
jgi:hypothetical protein